MTFSKHSHCWRADQEILIHDSKSWIELIFESAGEHVFVSNNSPNEEKSFQFEHNIESKAWILRCFLLDSYEAARPGVKTFTSGPGCSKHR